MTRKSSRLSKKKKEGKIESSSKIRKINPVKKISKKQKVNVCKIKNVIKPNTNKVIKTNTKISKICTKKSTKTLAANNKKNLQKKPAIKRIRNIQCKKKSLKGIKRKSTNEIIDLASSTDSQESIDSSEDNIDHSKIRPRLQIDLSHGAIRRLKKKGIKIVSTKELIKKIKDDSLEDSSDLDLPTIRETPLIRPHRKCKIGLDTPSSLKKVGQSTFSQTNELIKRLNLSESKYPISSGESNEEDNDDESNSNGSRPSDECEIEQDNGKHHESDSNEAESNKEGEIGEYNEKNHESDSNEEESNKEREVGEDNEQNHESDSDGTESKEELEIEQENVKTHEIESNEGISSEEGEVKTLDNVKGFEMIKQNKKIFDIKNEQKHAKNNGIITESTYSSRIPNKQKKKRNKRNLLKSSKSAACMYSSLKQTKSNNYKNLSNINMKAKICDSNQKARIIGNPRIARTIPDHSGDGIDKEFCKIIKLDNTCKDQNRKYINTLRDANKKNHKKVYNVLRLRQISKKNINCKSKTDFGKSVKRVQSKLDLEKINNCKNQRKTMDDSMKELCTFNEPIKHETDSRSSIDSINRKSSQINQVIIGDGTQNRKQLKQKHNKVNNKNVLKQTSMKTISRKPKNNIGKSVKRVKSKLDLEKMKNQCIKRKNINDSKKELISKQDIGKTDSYYADECKNSVKVCNKIKENGESENKDTKLSYAAKTANKQKQKNRNNINSLHQTSKKAISRKLNGNLSKSVTCMNKEELASQMKDIDMQYDDNEAGRTVDDFINFVLLKDDNSTKGNSLHNSEYEPSGANSAKCKARGQNNPLRDYSSKAENAYYETMNERYGTRHLEENDDGVKGIDDEYNKRAKIDQMRRRGTFDNTYVKKLRDENIRRSNGHY